MSEAISTIKMNILKFAWWSFALFWLILEGDNAMVAAKVVVKKSYLDNVVQREKGFDHGVMMETNHESIQSHSTSSHSHMDHSVLVFFTPKDLKVGKVLSVYFRPDPSTPPHLLPRDEAQLIPFSASELPFLLQVFGFSRGSPQAKAMEDTLRQCELKPIQGETKYCATSLESMLEFAESMLMTKFRGLNTRHMTKSGANHLKNYTIIDEPREVFAPKMVACHTMPYPYAVFYCHYHESESKVFQVMLRGENNGGELVEAIAVCHMDTSQWSHNHVSFQVLGIKPGSSPVCHFFPADNLVWVPVFNKQGYGEMAQ